VTSIQIIDNPEKKHWTVLLARPPYHSGNLDAGVRGILDDVKKNGDKAVDSYSLQFDEVRYSEGIVP
jgi:histidinol dehydrogenase